MSPKVFNLKDYIDVFSSFIIPMIILGFAYSLHGIYPFGDKTILICDMNIQYVDFFSAFYDILLTDKSMLYTWNAGMGLNFIGLYAYYLSSPFSFLIFLFEKQNLTEALLVITLIKIGSAGLMFSIYSRYAVKGSKISVVIFSVLYALMAYSVVYSFHLMFLDGVVLLPLVILGVEKILRENKVFLFIFSLTIIFIANFYIAYMVGIFSLLYFFVRFFSDHTLGEIKLFSQKLLLFGFSTILAVGFTTFLWLPTFFALAHSQDLSPLSLNWSIKFNLFDLLTKFQIGSYDTLKFPGLPNIYCGLLPLLLFPVFFLNNRIYLKKRMFYLVLLIFLIFSFNISIIDLAWHGFKKPTWFPFRYSFIFSFLILFLAYQQFNQIQDEDTQKVFIICTGWLIIIVLLQKFDYKYLNDRILVISLIFLFFYSLLIRWSIKISHKKKIILLGITLLVLMEAFLNSWSLLKRLDREFGYIPREEYYQPLMKIEDIIQKIQDQNQDQNQDLYRLEWIGARTMNSSMNLNYKGISHYSSMSNTDLHKFLNKLGFSSEVGWYMNLESEGLTAISASLMGVKYVISANEMGLGYKKLFDEKGFTVYENFYALPIGFMVNERLKELDITTEDPFRLQSDFIQLSSCDCLNNPNEYAISHYMPLEVINLELNNAVVSIEDDKEIFEKLNKKKEASVEIFIKNTENQQVYANFHNSFSDVDIYVNDKKMVKNHFIPNKTILDLGFHNENDVLRLKIAFNHDGFTLKNRYFFGLNKENLAKAIIPFKDNTLEVVNFSDTMIKGNIVVEQNRLLFTSIPYDPGWAAFIDGQPATIIKIGDAFIGLELTEGEHVVEFKFTPRGLKTGMFISISTVVVVLFVFVLNLAMQRKRLRENS